MSNAKPKCFTVRSGKVVCNKSTGAKKNYNDSKVQNTCSKRKGRWRKGCHGGRGGAEKPPTARVAKALRKERSIRKIQKAVRGRKKKPDKPKPKPDKPKPKPKPDKPKPKSKPKPVEKPKPKPKPKPVWKRLPKLKLKVGVWYNDEAQGDNTFVKYTAKNMAIIGTGPASGWKVFPVGKVSDTTGNKPSGYGADKQAYEWNGKRVDIPGRDNPIEFYRNRLVPAKPIYVKKFEKGGAKKPTEKKKKKKTGTVADLFTADSNTQNKKKSTDDPPHTAYKKQLGKKVKDFTEEERKKYQRLQAKHYRSKKK
tara:strand:+ start:1156 stop:2082 length:927 start_codon:yes stop_codon:yes gene_type:complete